MSTQRQPAAPLVQNAAANAHDNGATQKPTRGPKRPAAVGKAPIAPGDPTPGQGTGLPLPHERDESPGRTAAEPDPVMVQAKKDLDAGLVDTDLHNAPGLDGERRAELLQRERDRTR